MGNRTMTEELEQLLKNLKLRRMLEIYDEQLRAADKDDISYSEFVTRLVRAQFQARQEGAPGNQVWKRVGLLLDVLGRMEVWLAHHGRAGLTPEDRAILAPRF